MSGRRSKILRRLVRKQSAGIVLAPRQYMLGTDQSDKPGALVPWKVTPSSFRYAIRFAKKLHRKVQQAKAGSPARDCAFCSRGSERCILGGYR